jgi:leader peptidase (prepilin peptidase)/N-methyltransferase
MAPIIFLFIALIGLELGSFANVCIYRWPRNASILRPRRSHCVWCKQLIRWHDNIPVLSYVLLKGRCRNCHGIISPRYPLVELLIPVLFVSVAFYFQGVFSTRPVFLALLFYTLLMLVITTFTDLDWKIIPDEATYSLMVVGLALSAWNPFLTADGPAGRLLQSLIGALAGGLLLFLVSVLGRFLFKREAMGGGDVKLLAALGTVLGYEGVVITFFVSSIVGGLIAAPLLLTGRMKRHSYLPYGPFLNIAALVAMIFLLKKIS